MTYVQSLSWVKPQLAFQLVQSLAAICVVVILLPELAHGASVGDSSIAYIGDSETEEGGIGNGLTCLNHKNIIGFHSISAAGYSGKQKNCHFPSAYQPEDKQDPSCNTARTHFQRFLNTEGIQTIVVALGDNYSSPASFKSLLTQIKRSGKKCIWVKPSQKSHNGKDSYQTKEAQTSIKAYEDIAEEACGSSGIIDPSGGGSSYQTVSDGVHYKPAEGKKIAKMICQKLNPGGDPLNTKGQSGGTVTQNKKPRKGTLRGWA